MRVPNIVCQCDWVLLKYTAQVIWPGDSDTECQDLVQSATTRWIGLGQADKMRSLRFQCIYYEERAMMAHLRPTTAHSNNIL